MSRKGSRGYCLLELGAPQSALVRWPRGPRPRVKLHPGGAEHNDPSALGGFRATDFHPPLTPALPGGEGLALPVRRPGLKKPGEYTHLKQTGPPWVINANPTATTGCKTSAPLQRCRHPQPGSTPCGPPGTAPGRPRRSPRRPGPPGPCLLSPGRCAGSSCTAPSRTGWPPVRPGGCLLSS